jgi:hypothetical protein
MNDVKKLPPSAETMKLTTVLKTVPPTNPATFDSFTTAPSNEMYAASVSSSHGWILPL